MIYTVLQIAMGVTALLCIGAAFAMRSKRMPLLWAAAAAVVASISAGYEVFWSLAVFGLMVPWALLATMRTIDMGWRLRLGLVVYLLLGAALVIYPTFHQEVYGKYDDSALPTEERDALAEASLRGDAGVARWLTSNMEFRLVRGLDLAGGLRLVYNVDVEEAIKDKRDRYYDQLREALARKYGFVEGEEQPSVAELSKIQEKVRLEKSRDDAASLTVYFNDPSQTSQIIDDAFLQPFLNETQILRAADGSKIEFRIRDEIASDIRLKAVRQAKETVLRRIDGLGLKEAGVSTRDEDIIVEVPGDDDRQFNEIRDIISKTARLEFKLVDDEAQFFSTIAEGSDESWPKGLRFELENAPLGEGRTEARYVPVLVKGETESMQEALERFKAWTQTLNVPDTHQIGYEKRLEFNDETSQFEEVGWRGYYLFGRAEVTGDMIREAVATPDQSDAGFGNWYVSMEFTPLGADLFEKITANNIKRRFAIILDGKVESAPVIQSRIAGGRGQITLGSGSPEQQLRDARELELVLRAGALPAPLTFIKEDRIGPLLGSDSIDEGIKAALIGAGLVIMMMFLFYRRAGLVANLAVALNLCLQIAVLSMFSASLTLPGIAGLALTVGIAVDANVLINERIREELRAGKTARSAVDVGYEKAFSAIIDGHATTLISGLILAQYGSGPIKGFAVTLIIGIVTSLFTGVVFTRLLFDYAVRGRRIKKLSLG